MKQYKFLDVGCKTGKSFKISEKFGYASSQGIGIDINPDHVNSFIQAGNDGLVASAIDLPFLDNQFELVIFNHVLEHLPNEDQGFKSLQECLRVSSKYLYLALPFFDEDEYLNSLGFKTFYSDWTGHTNKVHFNTITKKYITNFKFKTTFIKPIIDSSAAEILPLSAPTDSFEYNEKIHGFKNIVKFQKNIWREYSILISK